MKISKYTPFFISGIVLFIVVLPQLINPVFPGDSGTRLLNASKIIVHQDNRVWLPFLQIQIYILYLLKVPLIVYKLLPLAYYLILLLIINKLAIRIIGTGKLETFFTSLLLVSLVSNAILVYLGNNLFQEMPAFSLLYLLLYFYLFGKKDNIWIYIMFFLAMLSREDFWIYYLVYAFISLPKMNRLNKEKIVIYLLYGLIPVFWLVFTNQPPWVGVNVKNSLTNLGEFVSHIQKFIAVYSQNSLIPISISLASLYLCFYLWRRNKKITSNDNLRSYLLFFLVSLTLIFFYIMVQDPWQDTPYNPRIIVPFIFPIPLWTLFCYFEIKTFPKFLRVISLALLFVGIIGMINVNFLAIEPAKLKKAAFSQTITNALSLYKSTHHSSPKIGVIGMDYWQYYVGYFSGPLVYENSRYFYFRNQIYNYDILITDNHFSDRAFSEIAEMQIDRPRYVIWFRK